jgi:hypothetical protein
MLAFKYKQYIDILVRKSCAIRRATDRTRVGGVANAVSVPSRARSGARSGAISGNFLTTDWILGYGNRRF